MVSPSFKGYFCGILSGIAYGMNPLFGKHLYAEGMGALSMLFYRFLFAAILLAALLLCQKKSFRVPVNHLSFLAVGGFLLSISCIFWFLSFQIMSSGVAATILFLYPIMVAVIMGVGYHEKITWSVFAGILLALAGVGLLSCGNSPGTVVNFRGVFYVIMAALTYAIYIVGVKESRLKTLPADTLTFYMMLMGLPVFLVALRGGMALQTVTSWSMLGNLLGLAFFPSFLSFWLMAVAIPYIGATKTAILGALEPTTAVLIGFLVFGETITIPLAVGMALVFTSVLLVVLKRR